MSERNILTLTRAGDPILHEVMPQVALKDITSDEIQNLIADIRYTNQQKEYGVGLAAPQVGVHVALSVIGIKPTPNRPDLEPFEQVIINPKYKGIGRRTGMWEGCQSFGKGDDTLFGKALRYQKIGAEWFDEAGRHHQEVLSGFVAHVFQHETDHLNGVLFVEKVSDAMTFMMADEYQKRIVKQVKS